MSLMLKAGTQMDGQDVMILNQRSDMRRFDKFGKTGFGWGPPAKDVAEAFPEVFATPPRIGFDMNLPNPAENAFLYDAFPDPFTIWVFDPKSPEYGIWMLNTTSVDWTKASQDTNNPVAFGWYWQASNKLPSWDRIQEESMKRRNFAFSQNVIAALRPPVPGTTVAKVEQTPSFELTVWKQGRSIFAAMTASESMDRKGPHPDMGIAGQPFEKYSNGLSPEEVGLPLPLLAFQPDGSIKPAVPEFRSIYRAAVGGSKKAQAAMSYFNIGPEDNRLQRIAKALF